MGSPKTATAKKAAAAKVGAKRKADKAMQATQNKKKKTCNLTGFNVPKEHGTWSGIPGESVWMPDANSPLAIAIISSKGSNTGITYKDGFPDFGPFVVEVNNQKCEVDIDMKGNRGSDFTEADHALATKVGKTKTQVVTMRKTNPKATWHHVENTVTMQLVPTAIHGNAPHSGAVSIIGDPLY